MCDRLEVHWLESEKAYTFRPMMVDKKHKGAFMSIKGITIKVTQHNAFIPIEKGALALAFKQALAIIEQSQ